MFNNVNCNRVVISNKDKLSHGHFFSQQKMFEQLVANFVF